MASPFLAQGTPPITSPPTSQVAPAPSIMPGGYAPPPQHYQAPPPGQGQANGVPLLQGQAPQGSPFPNGHYYPPPFFYHQQGHTGQNAPPHAYPFHPVWYPTQYQAPPGSQAPTPTPATTRTAPEPAATRSAPAAPEAAFGIDPALLADGELLPPPSVARHGAHSHSGVAPSTIAARDTVASSVTPTPLPGAPVGTAGEASPSTPVRGEAAPRPQKRRRPDNDDDDDNNDDDNKNENEDQEEDGEDDSSAVTPSTTKRLVACKSKPIHEHVIGAGTGGEIKSAHEQSDAEKIFRTRELPKPFILQAASTRHYRRNIPEILTRIENLASRCGCLTYFAIQHFESGENFYYYISDALRDWAPRDVRDIHKKVASTFSNVMAAYQAAKVELQREMEVAQRRAKKAEQEAEALRQKHNQLVEDHARDLEELERYRANSAPAL